MWIIIACIIINAFIGVIFKFFTKYKIDNLQAIIVNYFVCVLTGAIVNGGSPIPPQLSQQNWFPYALFLGVVFIIVFNLMALTVQYFGIMISTVFQKMSMIAPTLFAILWYHEVGGWMKWVGIILASLSILLLSYQRSEQTTLSRQRLYILFPILTFLGSCIIDSTLYYIEKEGYVTESNMGFVSTLFLFAGISGLLIFILQSFKTKPDIQWKNILGGIALGIPNFFSIYLLLLALQQGFDGSVVFPINNIGILVTATILGIIIFHERMTKPKLIGFGFAVLAIILIAFTS